MPDSFENPDKSNRISATEKAPLWPASMVTFDRMVAYLRHEMLNAVTPAVSILDLLRNELVKMRYEQELFAADKTSAAAMIDRAQHLLENGETTIELMIERVAEVTRWLATFYIPGDTAPVTGNIHKKLDETLRWIELELHDIVIVKNYGNLPLLPFFPGPMGQLFLNIFRNAVTAMEGHGVITIDTGVNNSHAEIRISDTGPGIPDDLQKNLFEPGFTTRRGSAGLGLAICRDIIQSHRGSITITSRVGHGTTVTIALPLDAGH
jgi:signal transduction histidine kinase